jgi:hypothetical protein
MEDRSDAVNYSSAKFFNTIKYMKRLILILSLFSIAGLMLFVSCESDSGNCTVEGALMYVSDRWEIHSDASSDSVVLIYVARDHNIELDKGEWREVRVTGNCVQSNDIKIAIHDDLPPMPTFVTYYIDVKTLKFK